MLKLLVVTAAYLLLVSSPSSVRAEDCDTTEVKSRQHKFATCQRKEINAHRTQGGTKCLLLENIIETCNSMWYFCASSQQEIIERKGIYVKQFMGRYMDASLSEENCTYINPFRMNPDSENEIQTEELCKPSVKSSVQEEYITCMYNYASTVTIHLHDSQFPGDQLVASMCQAINNLTADCAQLIQTCFHPAEQKQMVQMSKEQMLSTFLSFNKTGITEDVLDDCETKDDTTTTTTTPETSTAIFTTKESSTPIETSTSYVNDATGIPETTTTSEINEIFTELAERSTIMDVIVSKIFENKDGITTEENEEISTTKIDRFYPTTTESTTIDVSTATDDLVEATEDLLVNNEDKDIIATTAGIQEDELNKDELYNDIEVNPPTQSSFKFYQEKESFLDDDFFQSDSDEKLTERNTIVENTTVTSDDNDNVVESGTLAVDIQVEISDYEHSPKDSLYTSDFNSLDSDDRNPLVISSGQPVQNPDTQKRSSPEIAESHSGSSAKITGTFPCALMMMSTLLFIRF